MSKNLFKSLINTKISYSYMGLGKVQFFTNVLCPYSHRVNITLNECKVDYDSRMIPLQGMLDFMDKLGVDSHPVCKFMNKSIDELKDKKIEYKKLIEDNGSVPVIFDHGKKLDNTEEICFYLDSTYNNHQLWTQDRQQSEQWKNVYKTFMLENSSSFGLLENQYPQKDAQYIEIIENQMKTYMNSFQKFQEGPYYNGKQFTIVDIATFTYIYRFQIFLSHYRGYNLFNEQDWSKKLKDWYLAVAERESVQKTMQAPQLFIDSYILKAHGNLVENGQLMGRGVSQLGK